jgi:hypothetical protein
MLEGALRALLTESSSAESAPAGREQVTLDFHGVEGMAPSFLDELLSVFELVLGGDGRKEPRSLIVAHPPTRLSLKFEAVARGHGLSVQALPDESWLLVGAANPGI